MAIVIHTIKGNGYAYDHHRVGSKVVCTYLGPVSKGGTKEKYSLRQAEHGGGAKLHNSTGKTTPASPKAPKAKDSKEKDKGEKLHNALTEDRGRMHSSIVRGVNPAEQEKIKAQYQAEYKENHGNLNRKVGRVARRVDSYETIDNNTIKTQGHTVKHIEGKDGLNIDGKQVPWSEIKDYIKM